MESILFTAGFILIICLVFGGCGRGFYRTLTAAKRTRKKPIPESIDESFRRNTIVDVHNIAIILYMMLSGYLGLSIYHNPENTYIFTALIILVGLMGYTMRGTVRAPGTNQTVAEKEIDILSKTASRKEDSIF